MIKILKKAMRNPEFHEPGFAWMKIACYLSLTGRTDCCCWLFSVFLGGFFVVVVVVVFFLKTLNCCFCSWGVGKRWRGFFILPCFVCFVNVFVTLKNFFLEGKVIKFIVQKGVYLGSKMKLLCLGACLVCLM